MQSVGDILIKKALLKNYVILMLGISFYVLYMLFINIEIYISNIL